MFDLAHTWDTIVHSGFPIFFWVRPRWNASQIPSQAGKVVLVTGGNSGTGYETCKALYESGANVYLACRTVSKGEQAIKDIKKGGTYGPLGITYPKEPVKKSGGSLTCVQLDLADLNSITRFAEDFKKREKKIDLLFANAGVMASPEGMFTEQGYTLQFGTNTLGHQRLISLLLPLLLTASSTSSSLPRVIATSSAGHATAPPRGFNPKSVVRDPSLPPAQKEDPPKKGAREYPKWVEYGQSKWGNIAVGRYLHWMYGPDEGRAKEEAKAEREGKGDIISIVVHPGIIATNLAQHLSLTATIMSYIPWIANLFTQPATVGASNQLWAATCPEGEARKMSGEYIVPFQRIGVARPDLNDQAKVESVWEWCELQGKRHQ